jgi:AraC-like DNA-binding protein
MTSVADDFDLRPDIAFDCQVVSRHHKPARSGDGGSIWIANYAATVVKPTAGWVTVPAGLNMLCLNYEGALLARMTNVSRLAVLPPRSMTFVRGGSRGAVQAARGDHSLLLITCPTNFTPALDGWFHAATSDGTEMPTIAVRAIDPHFLDFVARIEHAVSLSNELTAPLIVGAMHDIAVQLLTGPSELHIAVLPPGLPETIRDLVDEVREDPSQNWSLKDAADKAGYSPFHFSRVFKSLVGYGFHEYVDRCRTEAAVTMLVSTESPVDSVAAACGFGTTQGFRESIKEYLGLVPSELRSLPESLTQR